MIITQMKKFHSFNTFDYYRESQAYNIYQKFDLGPEIYFPKDLLLCILIQK
jgi:hypothetical protein